MASYFWHFGASASIIVATILLAFLVNRFFVRLIRRSTQDMRNDPTNYKFFRHVFGALVYIVGFSVAIYVIPDLRVLASSLLAGAGILAVAIGFASQHALSNIISGIFIVMFKPFRVNDRLEVRGLTGIVEDISLRHTVIRDFENRRILIPNTLISDEVIINSDFVSDKICKRLDVRISYDSDLDKAKALLQEIAMAHPLRLEHRTKEEIAEGKESAIEVRVIELGEYAVRLKVWVWVQGAPEGFLLACDFYEQVKRRFQKEGIDIPYPHRTVVQKVDNN